MLIPNNLPPIQPFTKDTRKVKVGESSRRIKDDVRWERRRQPDRRQQQTPLSAAERRHRTDRRQAKLLNAHSKQPEKVSSQKGRTINTRA